MLDFNRHFLEMHMSILRAVCYPFSRCSCTVSSQMILCLVFFRGAELQTIELWQLFRRSAHLLCWP